MFVTHHLSTAGNECKRPVGKPICAINSFRSLPGLSSELSWEPFLFDPQAASRWHLALPTVVTSQIATYGIQDEFDTRHQLFLSPQIRWQKHDQHVSVVPQCLRDASRESSGVMMCQWEVSTAGSTAIIKEMNITSPNMLLSFYRAMYFAEGSQHLKVKCCSKKLQEGQLSAERWAPYTYFHLPSICIL